MALQFKILDGLTLNINKGSLSVTLGRGGHKMTINTKGQVTKTVGIPGTGIFYRKTNKIGGNKNAKRSV
jgi:hypothetical protein